MKTECHIPRSAIFQENYMASLVERLSQTDDKTAYYVDDIQVQTQVP